MSGRTTAVPLGIAVLALWACLAAAPMPSRADEITTETRMVKAKVPQAHLVRYRRPDAPVAELRWTPRTYTEVTLVRAGPPGTPPRWETALPGRSMKEISAAVPPRMWLLLTEQSGWEATHRIFCLDTDGGVVEWMREYPVPAEMRLLEASPGAVHLGVGPYVEELDPATGTTRGRRFVADPPQSLVRSGDILRVRTLAGADFDLPARTAFQPPPPSPDRRMAAVLLTGAVNRILRVPRGGQRRPGGPPTRHQGWHPDALLNAVTLKDYLTLGALGKGAPPKPSPIAFFEEDAASGGDDPLVPPLLTGRRTKAMRAVQGNAACLPVLEREVRLDPDHSYLRFFLGLALRNQGREEEAEAEFVRAASVPGLPFFEYAALGNLFELCYLPAHADRCYAAALRAFRVQVPLAPVEYCPERLHRAFFPADLEAGRVHIGQGNILRYLELRTIRRQMFLHSDDDYLATLRALELRDDPRLRTVVEGETAYLANLKRDPFVKENHLWGLDVGVLLVRALAGCAVLFLALAALDFLLLPVILPFIFLFRWMRPLSLWTEWYQGYPVFLVLAIKLLFFPVALFEFAVERAAYLLSHLAKGRTFALLGGVLAALVAFSAAIKHFSGFNFSDSLGLSMVITAIALAAYWAVRSTFSRTDFLPAAKAALASAAVRRPWLVPAAGFGTLCALASLAVSWFPLSDLAFRPEPGMTFLYAHPEVARRIEERAASVRGVESRQTLLFLKAAGLHLRGRTAEADALYGALPRTPWVMNNQAAVLFQQGRREEAVSAWRALAAQGIPAARANLEGSQGIGGRTPDPAWVPLLANPPSEKLFAAFVRRSPVWDPGPAVAAVEGDRR